MAETTTPDTREGLLRKQYGISSDSYIADGESLDWLIQQLVAWPRRVHPERTTNDRFLRESAALTLAALSTATPPVDGEAKMREALRRFVHAYSAAAGCIDFGLLREAYEQAREALSKNGELVC